MPARAQRMRTLAILAFMAAFFLAAAPARAEYWEAPDVIAEGRFPTFFAAKAGPIVIWQESQSTGDETGKARIRFARYEGGAWIRGDVSDSSYAYSSTGAPPLVYSAAQSKSGVIAVAVAASGTSIEIKLSRDGGRSFAAAAQLESATTSVAPRIYPSATGGWIVFATRGRAASQSTAVAEGSAAAAPGAAAPAGTAAPVPGASSPAASEPSTIADAAAAQMSSVSLYVARSADGSTWSRFESLVAENEKLPMNFAPVASSSGSKDIVLFQTFILGEGDESSRYAIMSKTSLDGGATWTRAKAVSDFDADAKSYDNQGPQLVVAGGKLYAAWERRKVKATQTQVWATRVDETGSFDPKTARLVQQGVSGSFMLSAITETGGMPEVISREDKLKANRVFLSILRKDGQWESEDADLASRGEKAGVGLIPFARAAESGKRSYVAWQLDTTDNKSRILAMVPDTSVAAPTLSPLNFTPGKRSRTESIRARLGLPEDASGIAGYAYLWKKTPDKAVQVEAPPTADIWKQGEKRDARILDIDVNASQDGAWTLWASVEDRAGNFSAPAALSYYRKKFPPAPPVVVAPDLDDKGFLASSSFTIRWTPPEADDVAGYTWDLAYAGPFEGSPGAPGAQGTQTTLATAAAQGRPAKTIEQPKPAALPSLPGLSPYESALLRALGARLPPPTVRGSAPSFSAENVDNGYYLFSVSAIDTTGNVSSPATILLKSDKFKPYTTVTLAESSRDDLGRSVLRLLGRGFLADGRIERVAMSRVNREPYDADWKLSRGEYRIGSDRELGGLTFDNVPSGSYRIGLYHSTRGWYWTAPILTIDSAGTVKYGYKPDYAPSLRPFAGLARGFSIYDAMALLAMLFAAVGILLASRQVVAVAREGEFVRREAIALITGGPMPQAQQKKAAGAIKRRGTGLRAKFTFTIAFLVIFIVLLLSVFLGYNMIRRTSSELAMGLDQRARVLLESVAQGGRFFIGKEDAVTQLSIFPSQARAMAGANYITITGRGADPKADSGEVVYATSDPGIIGKLEPATLNVDKQVVLGRSVLKLGSGADPLAELVPTKSRDLNEKADFVASDQLKLKDTLAQEKASLKANEAGNQRRSEINTELDAIDVKIREKLASLSDGEVGSLPAFDPSALAAMPATYLYYKPIIEYRPGDKLLYRGMVRLEVSTAQIKAEVRDATAQLVSLTLIIAAIALAAGIVGAFILSSAIVRPIRKLVAQIERIRDTDDKETLEGSKIEVKSRDELFALADTVNQMTEGLVAAAKANKELTVGKGIQKMFIPLDPAPGSKTKLSTGRREEKDFEVYGYYEGAKGVSGDYWDFRSINSRYHYFIKCDISGKGVSAALIMVQVATMVINYFNEWKKAMPKAVELTDLTYKINDFLEERQFVGRFAAFTLGVWDSAEGIAYLCEAGDRKLHVWDEAQGKLVEELLPDSPAAGPLASFMVQMKKPFIQITRKLGHGDALMLYTDGIEEAKRHFRDEKFDVVECRAVPKDQTHENHSGGQDNEEFGYDRITAVMEAVASKGSFRLEKHHNPTPGEVLSFDFSSCDGALEDKILALVAVEKVFRMYKDPATTEKDTILVDEKIDAFLEKHFDQYRLYCASKAPYVDSSKENPGYLLYRGLKEDSQYDDLTILGIRRK
jgi:serine phosphatase RsbU (regulator of sigma subunit)